MTPETADQETSSDLYASRFSGAVGSYFLERQSSIIERFLKDKTKSVLEVGGGHGQLIPTYLKLGLNTTVVGSNLNCKKRIQTFLDSNHIAFIEAPLNDLPFKNFQFDTAVAIRLLTHSHDWKKLVKELCRVAKTQVIIDYPSKCSSNIFYSLLYPLKKASEKTTRTFYVFTDSEIINAFSNEGFTVQYKEPQFFLPMVIYRKVGSAFFARSLESIFSLTGLTKMFGSPTLISFVRS